MTMKDLLNPQTKPTGNGLEHTNGNGAIDLGDAEPAPIPASIMAVSGANIEAMRPRRNRLRIVLPVALVLLLAAGLAYWLFFRPARSLTTASVTRGAIISIVQTTGKLQAETSAKLAFKAGGRVDKVVVKQGDTVKAGDVLAALDASTLQRSLDEAKIQLEISKLKLQQAKEGTKPQDITAATANLNAAIARLDNIKSGGRVEDVAAAQAALNQAQAKFDAVKRGAAKQDIEEAQADVDRAQAALDAVKTGGASAEIAAAQAGVTKAKAALDKLKAEPTAEDLRQAEAGVAQAKANLDKVKRGATEDEIKEAQAQVDAAQAALDKLKAGPSATDLAILEQQINLAQLAVDSSNAEIADAQLISPIAGTILTMDLDVGELVSAQQPVASVADIGSLRIKADVDEIDVGKVGAGQAVTVTLDAYPGVKMPGKIDELAPGATQKQGSTVYQATVSFTAPQGVTPREGMAANVDITAQRKDNVLLLPNRAFETVGNRQYVTLSENGTTRKIEVETGLSNNTDTEVLSGLHEGQVVVLK